jgi:hypothetical protein
MRKYQTMTRDQAESLRAKGYTFTGAGLYEPDHAPKGTRFVMILGRPYRIWEPGAQKAADR